MRRVGLADIVDSARALASVDPDLRDRLICQIINHAHKDDTFRRRTGRFARAGSNGSLGAIARQFKLAKSDLNDPDFRRCLRLVLEAIDADTAMSKD